MDVEISNCVDPADRRLAQHFQGFPELADVQRQLYLLALNPSPSRDVQIERLRNVAEALLPVLAAVNCSPLVREAVDIEREVSRKAGHVRWQDAFDRAIERGYSKTKAEAIAELVNSHQPGRPVWRPSRTPWDLLDPWLE